MFSDLTNNSLNKIDLNKVKASPSSNSPNDGGFNSEENLRWIINKIATKPFITGTSQEDIDNAFVSTGGAGNGIYIKGGMFGIDGYTIKLSKQEDLSYDTPLNENAGSYATNNTQYVQRFSQSISNQGTDNQLPTSLADFAFERYTRADAEQQDNWDAIVNGGGLTTGTLIGFIKNIYTDSFLNQLTINTAMTTVSFGDTTIEISGSVSNSSTQNDSFFDTRTNPVAFKETQTVEEQTVITKIGIFYPVYVKNIKKWNTTSNTYEDVPTIYFTDIYGLTFQRGLCICDSKTYPRTNSVMIDMTGNTHFNIAEDATFTDCDLTTFPSTIYNGMNLYSTVDSQTVRSTTAEKADITESSTDLALTSITCNGSQLFNSYTVATLMTQYVPSTETGIQARNELTYYCLPQIPDDLKLTVGNTSTTIPIAFMTSNGDLCPNGFIQGSGYGTSISDTYPVEGYLHMLKRLYLTNIPASAGKTMSTTTTADLLNSWETLMTIGSNQYTLGGIYNTYIIPAICFYIDFCYSSLLDNVVFQSAETDSERMKVVACGEALNNFRINKPQTNPYLTDGEFEITQTIIYNGYTYNSTSEQYVVTEMSTTQPYKKEIDSDYTKMLNSVVVNNTKLIDAPTGYDDITDFEVLATDYTNKYYGSRVEDPIMYLAKCCRTSSVSETINGRIYVTLPNVPLYYLAYDSGYTMKTFTSSGNHISEYTAGSKFLYVDDYLLPTKLTSNIEPSSSSNFTIIADKDFVMSLKEHSMVVLNDANHPQVSSLVNGLSLRWNQYTWYIDIPYVITLNKDAENYLLGQDYTDPTKYAGVNFGCKLPKDVSSKDLMVAYLMCSTSNVIGDFDIETCDRQYDTTSKYIKQIRESCIHFNKLYGDNNESLDDKIDASIATSPTITNLDTRLTALDDPTIGAVASLDSRVSAVEGDITSIQQNYAKVYSKGSINIGRTSTPDIASLPNGQSATVTVTIDTTNIPEGTKFYAIINQVCDSTQDLSFMAALTCTYYTDYSTTNQIDINFVVSNNTGATLDGSNQAILDYIIIQK